MRGNVPHLCAFHADQYAPSQAHLQGMRRDLYRVRGRLRAYRQYGRMREGVPPMRRDVPRHGGIENAALPAVERLNSEHSHPACRGRRRALHTAFRMPLRGTSTSIGRFLNIRRPFTPWDGGNFTRSVRHSDRDFFQSFTEPQASWSPKRSDEMTVEILSPGRPCRSRYGSFISDRCAGGACPARNADSH
jgi:hypothetical protein